MVLVLCDEWALGAMEHFVFADMCLGMIPKFLLRNCSVLTMLAFECLQLKMLRKWFMRNALL